MHIYYISFDTNPATESTLSSLTDKVEHFPAVRGVSFDAEDLFRKQQISMSSYSCMMRKRRNEKHNVAHLAAYGCFMSHAELWRKCVERNEIIGIAEHDVTFKSGGAEKISAQLGVLSSADPIMLTTSDMRTLAGDLTSSWPDFHHGSQLYFVNPSAAKLLLQHAFPIDMQVDYYLQYMSYTGIVRRHHVGTTDQLLASKLSSTIPKQRLTATEIVVIVLAVVCFLLLIALLFLILLRFKNK